LSGNPNLLEPVWLIFDVIGETALIGSCALAMMTRHRFRLLFRTRWGCA